MKLTTLEIRIKELIMMSKAVNGQEELQERTSDERQ